jgi:hypothetical protein
MALQPITREGTRGFPRYQTMCTQVDQMRDRLGSPLDQGFEKPSHILISWESTRRNPVMDTLTTAVFTPGSWPNRPCRVSSGK